MVQTHFEMTWESDEDAKAFASEMTKMIVEGVKEIFGAIEIDGSTKKLVKTIDKLRTLIELKSFDDDKGLDLNDPEEDDNKEEE